MRHAGMCCQVVAVWRGRGKVHAMELSFAFFADRASVPPDGKLYVLGGGFTGIGMTQLPGRADFAVVAQFRFIAADAGRTHLVELRLVDADGKPAMPAATLQFQAAAPSENPGGEITIPTVTPLQPMFSSPGMYAVELWYEARILQSLPLRVMEAPARQ